MTSSDLHVIVGLGATGLSCARFLKEQGVQIAVTDTRINPPHLELFKKTHPDIPVILGGFDTALLERAASIILSPGIALRDPTIAEQVRRGTPVIGDIELFARAINQPVIGITGTNAKSTVTTLVGNMAKGEGLQVQVGGNLGIAALDLLKDEKTDLFVLELSSFQLETTYSLKPKVASILNITPDHMDRYVDLAEYKKAKHRIYQQCHTAVCNRDDNATHTENNHKYYFTLNVPEKNEFGLVIKNKTTYLAFEDQLLLPINDLPIMGKHYQANALAALAIGYGFGLKWDAMLNVLREFKGLPHRCQLVRERNEVKWYNDSKGTNVGATLAAILGLGGEIEGKLVLIAGGVGKNADFNPLIPALEKYVRHVVLIGEAAEELSLAIGKRIPYTLAKDMQEAILQADSQAKEHDCVLLSPACASFDMFNNYEHRGNVFMELVHKL